MRGVEVCGRSEVCGWGGVDVGGGSMSVLLVYRCSYMCIVCVFCVLRLRYIERGIEVATIEIVS